MKTHIIAIIDTSSSMGSIWREAVDAFDAFIVEQAELPGEGILSVTTFDSRVSKPVTRVPLQLAPKLAGIARPSGMTAMYDGVGTALMDDHPADKTIVVVLTDGHENSSKRYSADQVRSMVQERQAAGWEFIFLAANIDAAGTASAMGMSTQYATNYAATGAGIRSALATASATTTSLRGTTF